MQKPVDVAQQAGQCRIRADGQHRRHVAAVEHHLVVGPALDHVGDPETDIGSTGVPLPQELEA